MLPDAPARAPQSLLKRAAGLASVVLFLARKSLFKSRLTMALLVAAVAAGVGFQIPNAANMLGYQAELIEEGVSASYGDVRLRPRGQAAFEDGDTLAETAAAHPGVRSSAPILTLAGAVGREGRFLGSAIIGVRSKNPDKPFRLIQGSMLEEGDDKGLLLGSGLAARLGVRPGDTVQLRVVLSTGPSLLPEENVGRYALSVRGLVGGAFGAYEAVFVDIGFLREEASAPRAASMVLVYTGAPFAAQDLAAKIRAAAPEADVRAWVDDNAYLKSAIHAISSIAAVSNAMVVAAVAIPVLSLLYINVLSRRREVGVLSALGFGQAEVFAAFLLQALLVGLLGVALGCGIGYAVVRYFQANPIFEWEAFVIRPVLAPECFLRPSLIVLATTLAAGVYPAFRASRIDPAKTLRGID